MKRVALATAAAAVRYGTVRRVTNVKGQFRAWMPCQGRIPRRRHRHRLARHAWILERNSACRCRWGRGMRPTFVATSCTQRLEIE